MLKRRRGCSSSSCKLHELHPAPKCLQHDKPKQTTKQQPISTITTKLVFLSSSLLCLGKTRRRHIFLFCLVIFFWRGVMVTQKLGRGTNKETRREGAITARQKKKTRKKRMARVNSAFILFVFFHISSNTILAFWSGGDTKIFFFCFRQKWGNDYIICFLRTETKDTEGCPRSINCFYAHEISVRAMIDFCFSLYCFRLLFIETRTCIFRRGG